MCENADSYAMVYSDCFLTKEAHVMLLCCSRLIKKWSYWLPIYFCNIMCM